MGHSSKFKIFDNPSAKIEKEFCSMVHYTATFLSVKKYLKYNLGEKGEYCNLQSSMNIVISRAAVFKVILTLSQGTFREVWRY